MPKIQGNVSSATKKIFKNIENFVFHVYKQRNAFFYRFSKKIKKILFYFFRRIFSLNFAQKKYEKAVLLLKQYIQNSNNNVRTRTRCVKGRKNNFC